ncbi:MAG: hypothetical protein R3E89_03045 [Thiolinea sp.]
MKLLLDENLSYKLEQRLQDIFPGTQHVRPWRLKPLMTLRSGTMPGNMNL